MGFLKTGRMRRGSHQWPLFTGFLLLMMVPSGYGMVLDWPLGDTWAGRMTPGYRIRISQNYANHRPGWFGNRPHAGIDLVYSHRSNDNAPVYAAADGYVRYAGNRNYPGWVVVLEHTRADGSKIYTQYGHLDQVSVSAGAFVPRGTKIGTMIPQANNNTHLHFEVRKFLNDPINNTPWGPGYGTVGKHPDEQGWLDPVNHIFTYRAPCTLTGVTTQNVNIRRQPSLSGEVGGVLPAGATRVLDAVPDTDDPGSWWFKIPFNAGSSIGYVAAVIKYNGWGSTVFTGQWATNCGQYLPGIYQTYNWDTDIHVRNNRLGPNTVTVGLFSPTGTKLWQEGKSLGANQSWKVSFPDSLSVTFGTAIVVAQYGEDVAAVARIVRKNDPPNSYASFEAIQYPASKQSVPVVHKNNSGWYNRIFVFNTTDKADVSVSFTNAPQCNYTRTVDYLDTLLIDTAAISCLPNGYVGRVTVTSKRVGSNSPGGVAVMSIQEKRSGSSRLSIMATAISRQTGNRLFVPLVQNHNAGYLAGLGAEKGYGTGSLEARYYEKWGTFCAMDVFSSWPVIRAGIPASSNSCGTVLAAELKATGTVDHVYAQFNQLNGLNGTSYPAIVRPAPKAYIPYLEGSAQLRGIQIQNTTGTTANITARFYREDGGQVAAVVRQIAPHGTLTLLSEIPSSARNAKVESSRNIAVIVNNLMNAGARDNLMDYAAPLGH